MATKGWENVKIEDYKNRTFQPENGQTVGLITVKKSLNFEPGEVLKQPTPQQRTQALGRLPAGTMNKTEQKYADRLETLKHAGEILWYAFEPINIRLAANTFYKVDFLVLLASGAIEAHEVKGTFIREDSLVKIKIAAIKLPFQFCIMQHEKGEWKRMDF